MDEKRPTDNDGPSDFNGAAQKQAGGRASQHEPGQIKIHVAEDRLTARANRIDPFTTDDTVLEALSVNGIVFGVDTQAINEAIARAGAGRVQYGVPIAHGTPVQVLEPATVEFIPGLEDAAPHFDRLGLLFDGPTSAEFSGWNRPIPLVRKGDVIAEMIPARFKSGVDVFGQQIVPDFRYNATSEQAPTSR